MSTEVWIVLGVGVLVFVQIMRAIEETIWDGVLKIEDAIREVATDLNKKQDAISDKIETIQEKGLVVTPARYATWEVKPDPGATWDVTNNLP